jgi:hypothetical protein
MLMTNNTLITLIIQIVDLIIIIFKKHFSTYPNMQIAERACECVRVYMCVCVHLAELSCASWVDVCVYARICVDARDCVLMCLHASMYLCGDLVVRLYTCACDYSLFVCFSVRLCLFTYGVCVYLCEYWRVYVNARDT